MTSSNRVRLSSVREIQIGVTPGSPRMRTKHVNSIGLGFNPEYVDNEGIRDDRMNGAPSLVFKSASGEVSAHFRYPFPNSPEALDVSSAFCAEWIDAPSRDNDCVADAVITDIAVSGVVTVTTGPAFVAGQLVRFTGNANAANNGTFRCTTGSATVPAFVGAGLVAEAIPPAASRMKVVGAQGVAGDITATATGLQSTALNWTTLGLAIGQWIKVGGTLAVTRFATAALNSYARITAITATALTLDNLPVGWAVDAGAAKTITVWFGDIIRNGQTIISQTIEESFLGQSVPSHFAYTGQVVNTYEVSLESKSNIETTVSYLGMNATVGTTPLDAAYDPAISNQPIATNANIGRIAEGGILVGTPNCTRSLSFNINNNMRQRDCLASDAAVSIVEGECTVMGNGSFYFGDLSIVNKFLTGTASSFSAVVVKLNQAVLFELPAVMYRGGNTPQVTGKNTDVMLDLEFQSFKDELIGCHVQMNRFEYLEV